MPTQDQVVQAGICVYDYVLNPAVRGEFNRVLASAKTSQDNGSKVLQDFFDRQQYAATLDAFGQVFSDYEKNPLTPPLQATRLLRLTQEGNRKGDHQIFSLSSSNATPTQPLNPPGPLSRRTTRSVKIIAVAAVALLAAANTFARAENPARTAREHHACAVIMGLHQPGDLYDTCIRSLDKTLSELDQAKLVSTNRTRCAREGLKPGTPAFAICVVDAERSQADAGRNGATAAVR